MDKIRVLAMDDDNHDTSFCEESGSRSNALKFIQKLAKPHTTTYEVRHIYICDIPEEMYNDFNAVDAGRKDIPYNEAFERLWAISNKEIAY